MSGKGVRVQEGDSVSEINNRKDRIDVLVNIAKEEFDKKSTYEEILHRLNLEMLGKWTLSGGTRKEYINAVRARLEYLNGIKLQPSSGISASLDGTCNEQHKKKLSKPDQFFHVMRSLEGDGKNPVEHDILIEGLVKSGRFTQDEAERMVDGMRTRGRIYESRPDRYNTV
ncbi:MAG: hypothetical protein KGI33_12580 [Thaumarchaeota archaeon]|nr:hypothetical protein [Nitrososphaerota archaeon]